MSEQQIQKVRVKRLAHVGLWSTDVAAQTRFYRQVLGFNLRATEINSQTRMLNLRMRTLTSPLVTSIIAWDYLMIHDLLRAMDVALCSTLASIILPLKSTQMPNLLLWLLASTSPGIDLALEPRDGNPEIGDTLWFNDPDGNRIEISVTPDDSLTLPPASSEGRRTRLHPHSLQHLAIGTFASGGNG